ncbi:MAG TPA: hypothetical protein VJ867_00710 [Gemmatimonadaceae bacterium]|nr:hypothetical protein [Gemmatimonadaceae bacterium]
MLEHSITVRLQKAFETLPADPDENNRRALRSLVHEFVDVSKTKGAPVERVIIGIKQVAADAGIRSSTEMLRLRARLTPRDQVLLDVVRWAVERYFDYTRPPQEGKRGKGPLGKPPRDGYEMARLRRRPTSMPQLSA